jgi:hypothetical protein
LPIVTGFSALCPERDSGYARWRFADHDEVFETGDAFYVRPGQAPVAEAGSEFVQFSPSAPGNYLMN